MRLRNIIIGGSGLLAVGALAAPAVATARETAPTAAGQRLLAAQRVTVPAHGLGSAAEHRARTNARTISGPSVTEVTVDVPGTTQPPGSFAGCPAGSIAIKATAVELPPAPPPKGGPGGGGGSGGGGGTGGGSIVSGAVSGVAYPSAPSAATSQAASTDDGTDDGEEDGQAVPFVRLGRNEEGVSGAFVIGREGVKYRVTLTCLTLPAPEGESG